jgi:hypothetical protein
LAGIFLFTLVSFELLLNVGLSVFGLGQFSQRNLEMGAASRADGDDGVWLNHLTTRREGFFRMNEVSHKSERITIPVDFKLHH